MNTPSSQFGSPAASTRPAGGRELAETPSRWAALAPLLDRWQALAPRERSALTVAGMVVSLAVLWALAVQPAWTTLRTAPQRLDALDADLQRMRRLAGEVRELRATPPVSAAQAGLALKSATDRLGPSGKLVVQGDRATLTLEAVPSTALRAWLAEVRGAARARPLEMRLSQSGSGYSGTLVVAIGGTP